MLQFIQARYGRMITTSEKWDLQELQVMSSSPHINEQRHLHFQVNHPELSNDYEIMHLIKDVNCNCHFKAHTHLLTTT